MTRPAQCIGQAETSALAQAAGQAETGAQAQAAEQETMKKSPEILAVYSCPAAQIITNDDKTKEIADTVVYLYQDFSYVQYVEHDNRYEVYSEGSFELNFDLTEPGWEEKTPHILTVNVQQIHDANHELKFIDETYDVNLDNMTGFCLYPDNVRTNLKLVAAFMQVDKQKLVRQDGSEEYLPTMWFYYDDGSFQQYAVLSDKEQVLFSIGEYSVTNDEFMDQSVLRIHRTKKYQDGKGLTDYDSTHDYVIGELDFIRVYPDESAGDNAAILTGEINIDKFDDLVARGPVADECLEALVNGKVDAYVSDFTILASATIKHPGDFEIRGELFGPDDSYGVGLPKDSDGVAFVNEFLRTIEEDGTWAKLWKICFGDRIGGIEDIPEPPAIQE